MKKFKWEEDVDMYQHFFTFNNDIEINFSPDEIPGNLMHPDNQHLLYKSEFCKYYKPFVKRYFSPSNNIIERVNSLKEKYKIDTNYTLSKTILYFIEFILLFHYF